jgi:phospholipid/cholesterol/gamma-HCH transport system substrate-binding protein
MNNRVNYALIGFLVLFSFVLIFAFGYWLLKPTNQEETKKYLIYFQESVLGLNIDAPVKYRGISVGKVTKLRISPKNSEEVEVLVTILKTTPIKEDTIAKLTSQGITGLSYINLSMGKDNAPALIKKFDEEYPVIKSAPSFFENFENSLGNVSSNLTTTLQKTQQLLNEKNQKEFSKLLEKTALVMEKFDKLLDEKTIKHLHNSAKNLDSITTKTDKLLPNIDIFIDKSIEWENHIDNSFASIMNSYLGIRSAMDEIKRAISSGEFNFKDMTSDVLPTMNRTLLDMNDLMIKLQDTLNRYDRSPGDVIFKQEEIKKGPGER